MISPCISEDAVHRYAIGGPSFSLILKRRTISDRGYVPSAFANCVPANARGWWSGATGNCAQLRGGLEFAQVTDVAMLVVVCAQLNRSWERNVKRSGDGRFEAVQAFMAGY